MPLEGGPAGEPPFFVPGAPIANGVTMTDAIIPGPKWIPTFLETLAETREINRAVAASGVSRRAVYTQRQRNQRFSEAWKAALHTGEIVVADTALPDSADGKWQRQFLELLAQTSNIRSSAEQANVPLSTVYDKRRRSKEFAAKWQAALFEGYTNLEMEVLGYLRDSNPAFKMDVANALRLLSAHRETVAREKARRRKRDKASVLASLNAKIDKMRERKEAAARLLAEGANDGGN